MLEPDAPLNECTRKKDRRRSKSGGSEGMVVHSQTRGSRRGHSRACVLAWRGEGGGACSLL